MRIGYLVEGSSDRALLEGLRRRWCPGAEMSEGHFRGSTGESLRREIGKTFEELAMKAADVVVLLKDADELPWRAVKKEIQARIPNDRLDLAVVGVPDRNIECWICLDASYVARILGIPASQLSVDDPKARFESAMGIGCNDRKEGEIAKLVAGAPIHHWLKAPSFEDFYEQVRDISQMRGCTIENLREM